MLKINGKLSFLVSNVNGLLLIIMGISVSLF